MLQKMICNAKYQRGVAVIYRGLVRFRYRKGLTYSHSLSFSQRQLRTYSPLKKPKQGLVVGWGEMGVAKEDLGLSDHWRAFP